MKSDLLLEDLKRMTTIMNYNVGEPSTKNNVNLFESMFKEMLISKLESIHIIEEQKKTNLVLSEQSNKTSINEGIVAFPWKRGNDFWGYWKILYNTLKAGGIGVKWQVANDPVKSTFMYWGGWVIWQDQFKNGGYPVSFYDSVTKVSMVFKFQGGNYAGQPLTNIKLEPKSISATFNLAVWAKLSNKMMSDAILKYLKSNPKTTPVAKATPQDLKIGQQVFNELKYAFDGAGTYETEAVAAFNKIKNKFQLTELNRLVKARGYFSDVYKWLQDEMSDYDYKQYRAIWDRLKSIDKTIVAPKVNNALRVVSAVGDVTGVNALVGAGEAVGKAIQTLKNMTVGDIMEGFRSFLGGLAGGIVQILLAVFAGPLGAGITLFAWSILLIWDIYKWTQGQPNWWNLILDTFSVATAGLAAKALAPAKAVAAEAKTLPTLMSALQKKFPTVYKYVAGFGSKLSALGGKMVLGVKNAIKWLSSKLPFFSSFWNKLNGMVSKIGELIKSIDNAISAVMGGSVVSAISSKFTGLIQKAFPKLGEFFKTTKGIELAKKLTAKEVDAIGDYITGPIRGKTIEASTEWVCKNGTKAQCDALKGGNEYFKLALNVSKVGKSGTDVNKSLKQKEEAAKLLAKTKTLAKDTKKIIPGKA
jgi:hypothetical protein